METNLKSSDVDLSTPDKVLKVEAVKEAKKSNKLTILTISLTVLVLIFKK